MNLHSSGIWALPRCGLAKRRSCRLPQFHREGADQAQVENFSRDQRVEACVFNVATVSSPFAPKLRKNLFECSTTAYDDQLLSLTHLLPHVARIICQCFATSTAKTCVGPSILDRNTTHFMSGENVTLGSNV